MRPTRKTHDLARRLGQLSLEDGRVSAERVGAVLRFLQENPPRQPLAVLKQYRRLIARQLARSEALVEHAGTISADSLRAIEGALTRKYRRPIAVAARPDLRLIAGLRIRVGDDLYESSIAGQLAALTVSD